MDSIINTNTTIIFKKYKFNPFKNKKLNNYDININLSVIEFSKKDELIIVPIENINYMHIKKLSKNESIN